MSSIEQLQKNLTKLQLKDLLVLIGVINNEALSRVFSAEMSMDNLKSKSKVLSPSKKLIQL